jgi:diketogulonate reductase-like aldo/keto reductase
MSVRLTSGNDFPIIGLGTARSKDAGAKEILHRLLQEKVYHHLDTASMYNNEELIGEVLQEMFKKNILDRKDIFVTTKVAMWELNDIEGALRRSLLRLKLDFVDLYLIHWPYAVEGEEEGRKLARIPLHQQWAAMEQLHQKGLTKSLGVSNFNFQLLNDLLSYANVPPSTNQIELHPYLVQHDFVEWLKENKIVPVAYSPLARGEMDGSQGMPLHDPVIQKIADQHKRSTAQVILAWHLARGHAIIPKSSNFDRAKQNAEAMSLKLTPKEVEAISKLDKNRRFCEPKKWGKDANPNVPVFD